MIALGCRRCHSTNLRKNGHTITGQQKFHWKACHIYGTLDTNEQERAQRWTTVENLQLERLSQPAIARAVHMSRNMISARLKNPLDTTCRDHPAVEGASDSGA